VKLVIVPPALGELHDAAAFYTESANIELGLAFVAEFERTVNVILAVIAVAHHRRRPGYWAGRK
jgi:hypothetical protein